MRTWIFILPSAIFTRASRAADTYKTIRKMPNKYSVDKKLSSQLPLFFTGNLTLDNFKQNPQ
jgi:hypothetical protein